MSAKCTASSAISVPPVIAAAGPALSLGSSTIRYTAIARKISFSAAQVLPEDRRHRVRKRQDRRHGGRDRRHRGAAHARGGRPDEHDLVTVLLGRNLAAQHVVERVDLKRGPPVAVLVEVRVHLHRRIGPDLQLAERHALAQAYGDVLGSQVEALGRDLHRQRGIELVEILQHQGLGANRAVDVRIGVQVAERSGGPADLVDRELHAHRRQRQRARAGFHLRAHVPLHEVGQRAVGLAERLAQREQHRKQHVAGPRRAGGELAVGVQVLLGLLEQRDQRRQRVVFRGSRWRRLLRHFEQLGDVAVSGIDLRLAEKHRVADHLGFCARQQIDHLGVHFARPRPTADVGDAGAVDRDHRDPVRGRARGRLHPHVVSLALQALQQIAAAREQHQHDDDQTEKPVPLPESGLHGQVLTVLIVWRRPGRRKLRSRKPAASRISYLNQ